jgi:pyrroline-5-carboxylate reductase
MKPLTANKIKVGFIGLGNMGSRIAQRLLDHSSCSGGRCEFDFDHGFPFSVLRPEHQNQLGDDASVQQINEARLDSTGNNARAIN